MDVTELDLQPKVYEQPLNDAEFDYSFEEKLVNDSLDFDCEILRLTKKSVNDPTPTFSFCRQIIPTFENFRGNGSINREH